MVSNKSARGQPSKVSSSAAPAARFASQTAQKSAMLRSRFSPWEFKLSLFASVIQGLEGQHLRIHDTVTGRLRCEHAITSKATINCLDWGHYGENHSDRQHQESKKKRKRSEKVDSPPSDPVVAFGTSDSEILFFSPSGSKIVRVLRGEHTQGIRDFKFVDGGSNGQGWSVGGDGRMVQWNLRTGHSTMLAAFPGTYEACINGVQVAENASAISRYTLSFWEFTSLCLTHNLPVRSGNKGRTIIFHSLEQFGTHYLHSESPN